eukprot:g20065.t1
MLPLSSTCKVSGLLFRAVILENYLFLTLFDTRHSHFDHLHTTRWRLRVIFSMQPSLNSGLTEATKTSKINRRAALGGDQGATASMFVVENGKYKYVVVGAVGGSAPLAQCRNLSNPYHTCTDYCRTQLTGSSSATYVSASSSGSTTGHPREEPDPEWLIALIQDVANEHSMGYAKEMFRLHQIAIEPANGESNAAGGVNALQKGGEGESEERGRGEKEDRQRKVTFGLIKEMGGRAESVTTAEQLGFDPFDLFS